MLKNILNLKGAQQLNKTEQKSINGGGTACSSNPRRVCQPGYVMNPIDYCCYKIVILE